MTNGVFEAQTSDRGYRPDDSGSKRPPVLMGRSGPAIFQGPSRPPRGMHSLDPIFQPHEQLTHTLLSSHPHNEGHPSSNFARRGRYTAKLVRIIKMDIYDLTEATARTVLSDPNDYLAANDTSGSSSAAATPPGLDLADVWQFVLRCKDLNRFKSTTFMPTETVFGIGEGACYRVDRAGSNIEGDSRVLAIKYLKATENPSRKMDDVESRRSIETVLRELRVLTHNPIRECENIVQLVGYGSRIVGEHISMYLVAEFAAHGTLKGYLGKKREAGEKVSIVEKIKFCTNIANGLAALHASGIAQGDVKLENTLVCETETGEIVAKLSDFGHSIVDDESRYIGTTIFNPPVVRQGKSTSTLREDHYKCDIFSYGLMVWEIVQDGKRYVDRQHREDPITWLNGLPRDDLLRLALLATRDLLPAADASKVTLLQKVLESTLRDDAADRVTIREVMKFFNLEKEFVAKEK